MPMPKTMTMAIAMVAVTAMALALPLPIPARSEPHTSPPAAAPSIAAPPRSLIQRLREFLGINPPVAVGGSRSGPGQQVCLLSPWLAGAERRGDGSAPPLALTPTATPTLHSAGPLNEVQLLRDNRIVWRLRASSSEAITGPITWPLEPLQPGEQVLLRLRPRGAAGADAARITIQAGDAATLERYRSLLAAVEGKPERWQGLIEAQLPRNPALAVALASDPLAPAVIQQAIAAAAACSSDPLP